MKKISSFILLLFLSKNVQSQSIGNKPLSELDAEYIEIEEISRLLSNIFFIKIDYGQKTKLFTGDDRVKDENGFDKEFNSMIDALNFMSKYGYELSTVVTAVDVSAPIKRYILKKKKA